MSFLKLCHVVLAFGHKCSQHCRFSLNTLSLETILGIQMETDLMKYPLDVESHKQSEMVFRITFPFGKSELAKTSHVTFQRNCNDDFSVISN